MRKKKLLFLSNELIEVALLIRLMLEMSAFQIFYVGNSTFTN